MEINLRSSNEVSSSLNYNDKSKYNDQLDGAGDFPSQANGARRSYTQPAAYPCVPVQQQRQKQVPSRSSTQTRPHQEKQGPRSVITDVLPYCTTEPPLTQEQVIALSDIAGSVKELVLLALTAAAGDCASTENIVAAVGQNTANNIIDFFIDEWEVEG